MFVLIIVGRIEYKVCLKMLDGLFGYDTFTARSAASKMRTYITIFSANTRATPPHLSVQTAKQLQIKRVSDDLNRLYRMGFLNRRRIKRMALVGPARREHISYASSRPDRQQCHKGWQYRYRISKQGAQYIGFLRNEGGIMDKWERAVIERGSAELVDLETVRKVFPESSKRAVLAADSNYQNGITEVLLASVSMSRKRKGGRYNRFPSKQGSNHKVLQLTYLNLKSQVEEKDRNIWYKDMIIEEKDRQLRALTRMLQRYRRQGWTA